MSQWTLFSPPPYRSRNNTRLVRLVEEPTMDSTPTTTTSPTTINTPTIMTTAEIAEKNRNQPPFFLLVKRANPTTVELIHALTNEVWYRIHDTGRGTFSSKPDYEIFRLSAGDLLVSSIRYGVRNIEAKLLANGAKISDVTKCTSTLTQNNLEWRTSYMGRKRSMSKSSVDPSRRFSVPSWIAELECVNSNMSTNDEQSKVAAVKLFDGLPNGRIEIWDRNACVDVGGDWSVLDELVTLSYGNLEKARRRIMSGPDPGGVGMSGLGFGMGGLGIGGIGGI